MIIKNMHIMNSRQTIDIFLQEKKIAIAGVSRDPKKFGNIMFRTVKEKGYAPIPVNPKGGTIDEIVCIDSIANLGSDIHNLLIITHKRDTKKVLEEAISKGINNIWIQNGCETKEAIKIAEENNINLVSKACFLMYAKPKGFHRFHQTLAKWVGRYVN
jgi:predicted CoA-binding protein